MPDLQLQPVMNPPGCINMRYITWTSILTINATAKPSDWVQINLEYVIKTIYSDLIRY